MFEIENSCLAGGASSQGGTPARGCWRLVRVGHVPVDGQRRGRRRGAPALEEEEASSSRPCSSPASTARRCKYYTTWPQRQRCSGATSSNSSVVHAVRQVCSCPPASPRPSPSSAEEGLRHSDAFSGIVPPAEQLGTLHGLLFVAAASSFQLVLLFFYLGTLGGASGSGWRLSAGK